MEVAVRDERGEEVESLPRIAAHPPPDGVGYPVLVREAGSAGVVLAVEVESASRRGSHSRAFALRGTGGHDVEVVVAGGDGDVRKTG